MASGAYTHTHTHAYTHVYTHTHTYIPAMKVISRNQVCHASRAACAWFKNGKFWQIGIQLGILLYLRRTCLVVQTQSSVPEIAKFVLS